MEEKHTALPWHPVESVQAIAPQILSADGKKVIARLSMARINDARLPSEPEANANLSFIVRVCNVHDELITLLKAADNKLHAMYHYHSGTAAAAIHSLREKIAAAIAKAAEPIFPAVHCSQCGGDFGPGDSGFSHCKDHQHLRARD